MTGTPNGFHGWVWGLVIGLLLGHVAWRQESPQAAADSYRLADAERLYRELDGPHALQEASRVLAKIARLTTPSVVHIQSRRFGPRGRRVEETGSGVIVRDEASGEHYVVTNRHVVDGARLQNIEISLHDGRVLQPTSLLTDAPSDIAVMGISAPDLQSARWGDSDALEIGNMVLAMGSPFGLSQSVTLGIISAKGRRSLPLGGETTNIMNQDFLQTDAAINPGNSGGPLINLHGEVVGINTAIASNSGGNEGIGFSIPSNLVRRVVTQLLRYGEVRRAYLGVVLDPEFDVQKARRLGLQRLHGALVTRVMDGTPAARANIQPDDVILTFDGVEVQDENHLINLVSLSPVGKRVRLVIWRDRRKLTLEVILTTRQDDLQSRLPEVPEPLVEPM